MFQRLRLFVLLAAAVGTAAKAQNAETTATLIDDVTVSTRLTFVPPATVALSIPIGSILMPDDDGYQPMVVTEVRIENGGGRANELVFDNKTMSYIVMLEAFKKSTLLVTGYCLIDIAKTPDGKVNYRLSNKRVPLKTLDRLASTKDPRHDFQELLWNEVQRLLQKPK